MPQTREHFDICRLLGVRAGIVVINKIDMVDREMIDLVEDEVADTIEGSFLEGAQIIPVSAKTGEGIDLLKKAIHDLATAVPPRASNRLLRLPIDRAFSIRGFGTVITGTLTSGEIQKEQEIELIPGGLTARVRGIQVHGTMTGRAVAGQRTAVNLQGVDLAQVERGMVVTVPRVFRSTQILDVHLHLLPGAKPLKNLVKVRFHQGTIEVLARVALIGQETLSPGESTYAQLRLDTPVFCLHGDTFIIRQFSPTITIGGGTILHASPSKHKSTDKQTLIRLKALDQGELSERIPIVLEADAKQAMDLNELNSIFGLPVGELTKICLELAKTGKLVMLQAPSPILVLPQIVESLKKDTLAQISEFHKENPLQKGISKEELRKRIYDDLPLEVFRHCLDTLVEKHKISFLEDAVSLHGREVQLTVEDQKTRELIESFFINAGYQPPPLADLQSSSGVGSEELRRICFWMIKEKILIKLSEDIIYHRKIIESIKNQIKAKFTPGSKFGVADFKDLFDITRKHAIPLLEYLDRDKFTRRIGNDRILL
jgi:selenocysteine-specific elongation factor